MEHCIARGRNAEGGSENSAAAVEGGESTDANTLAGLDAVRFCDRQSHERAGGHILEGGNGT